MRIHRRFALARTIGRAQPLTCVPSSPLAAILAGVLAGALACATPSGERAGDARQAGRPIEAAALPVPPTSDSITAADFTARVAALTDPRTEGRATASAGERLAADHVIDAMRAIDLRPAGDDEGFRHRFEYSAGVDLGPANSLRVESSPAREGEALDVEWRPLAFSENGGTGILPVAFAGYGLVAPADGALPAVDEYADLEVSGRFVIVLRDLPHALPRERRAQLQRYASLRHKAMVARDRGARGILFVNGPRSRFREPLARLAFDATLAGSSVAALSIRDALADRWLSASGQSLASLQEQIDRTFSEAPTAPSGLRFELPGLRLAAHVDLVTLKRESHNVIGRLQVGDRPSGQTIVLGAHLDHLGRGEAGSSLAEDDEAGEIHGGADDNASGVAVLLEIAERLAARKRQGEALGTRDFVFAAWSGEELGLLGSDRWVEARLGPHPAPGTPARGPVAYLNFDMVGRLDGELVVHGAGSSTAWKPILAAATPASGLAIGVREDAYLPTDSTSFYVKGIPILSAFTGVHPEYHTPRDRLELLNAEGAVAVAALFEEIAVALSRADAAPEFVAQPLPRVGPTRGGMRVYLGTIPDYGDSDVRGVRLSGVAPEGPAAAAGLQGGDTIVEVDGQAIENLYDFTYALEALRVGEPARIVVLRVGERITFEVVPGSRD